MAKKLKIYTDGGARGNPGPAGVGVAIFDEKENLIKTAKKLGAEEVDCFLDSQLIVNQLNRKYKIKDHQLGSLFIKVWNLSLGFKKIKFHYLPRNKNKIADKLVNQAINAHFKS